jgi:AbrB family looped-hinge helix DNA binding protein
VRITSKGQITIPIEIREQLGLLPNTEVEFSVDRGGVRMVKATRPGARTRGGDIVEHMRGRATSGLSTDAIMRLMRG